MSRPRAMKTMGPPGGDPPIEIVHFADPWCWWSWGLEPVLQRLKEVYGENLKVTYKMGGQFESLQGWMEEYSVDERTTVDWISESIELTNMPVRPDYYLRTGGTRCTGAASTFSHSSSGAAMGRRSSRGRYSPPSRSR